MDKICKSLTGMNVDNLFEFKTKKYLFGKENTEYMIKKHCRT